MPEINVRDHVTKKTILKADVADNCLPRRGESMVIDDGAGDGRLEHYRVKRVCHILKKHTFHSEPKVLYKTAYAIYVKQLDPLYK